MKQLATLALLATTVVCTSSGTVQAQTPEDFATECAQLVDSAVSRVNKSLGDDTNRCIAAIRKHKANGEIAEARVVARRCIDRINNTTRAGDAYVREVCGRCVATLLDLGEFRLAARVRSLCADSLAEIEQSGERARNAVLNALN